MKFGRVPVAQATGALLAHSQRVAGRRLAKGHRLSAADVEALRAQGVASVMAARLETGDVPEDVAAQRVATAIAGVGARVNAPFTGRCNVYAVADGLALIDSKAIDDINFLDEAVTVATVPAFEKVRAGQMLATVKIIPFAVADSVIETGEQLAASRPGPIVTAAAFTAHTAGLVLTRFADTKPGVLRKTKQTVADRLTELGCTLAEVLVVDHHESAIAAAVHDLAQRDRKPVLVFGASAITDRSDVVPAGLISAGGTVDHLGMPVDPGNLLMLGHLRETPVLGVPGCARSPKLNGFDWVLQRLIAGLSVTRHDIQAMGTGGLLKEIPTRPQPRAGSTHELLEPPRAPRITALLLAAGQSRRMQAANKLLSEIDGVPMVARVADSLMQSQADPIIVVTGHQADAVRNALAGRNVIFVHNDGYATGLASSLRTGLAAVPAESDGAIVALGDMPLVRPSHIDRLIAAFNPVEGRAICVPTKDGKRGNPVLWAARFFNDMRQISGDVGARHLIGAYDEMVWEVAFDDTAILTDVDTPAALRRVCDGD